MIKRRRDLDEDENFSEDEVYEFERDSGTLYHLFVILYSKL